MRHLKIASIFAYASLLPALLTSCVAVPSATVETAMPRSTVAAFGTPAVAASAATGSALPAATVNGPSFVDGLDQRDRMRATLCLASAIYYEAATEPDEGQRAVAQVVLNRVRHPAWPHSVCAVVYQGSSAPACQFSFACDGAMARPPVLNAWIRARRVAEAALAGDVYAPVGSATYYHTLRVAPAWRRRLVAVGIVGAHIFYRQPGDGPEAATLPYRYAGHEPLPGPLPHVAPAAELLRIVALPAPATSAIAFSSSPRPAPVARRDPPQRDDERYISGVLPESEIRPEFREVSRWIGN